MRKFIFHLLKTGLFWLLFFAFFRIVFITVNRDASTPVFELLASFLPGLRMDLSFTGYLLLLIVVMQLISLPLAGRFCFRCIRWTSFILVPLFTVLLLADVNLYRYWGSHLNNDALSFLKTPGIILNSLNWGEVMIFLVAVLLLSYVFIVFFTWLTRDFSGPEIFSWRRRLINIFFTLFAGALLIIPIRGSFGVAPINTGVAYFSEHLFPNHAAINPLWNLGYSLKRVDKANRDYRFMDEEKAESLFDEMMAESGEYPRMLKSDNPDVVIILLESFSSQAMESLGGAGVTPEMDELMEEGIFFENVFSASVRSDFGLVGVLTGYPGLPGYSIMQYPERSKHLNFIPQILRDSGYADFNFLYGGDMGFKNMRSLITLAGFDDVVTMDDFPSEYRGQKWGVHDEYTFERFVTMIKESRSPSFNFFFTLSSHEPFDVPMERVYDDDYLNSVYYTDQCMGRFFDSVRDKGLWENTLYILIGDHGIVGPEKAGSTDRDRFHIPMLWTGGAVTATDTVVSKYASQVDLASTLLGQLNMEAPELTFSKNIFDTANNGFAFFHYHDGFGFLDEGMHQVFDISSERTLKMEGAESETDSLKAQAFLQMISKDFKNNK
ncbi:MAG: LTA synthase family protein [Marinilabilia sp.]